MDRFSGINNGNMGEGGGKAVDEGGSSMRHMGVDMQEMAAAAAPLHFHGKGWGRRGADQAELGARTRAGACGIAADSSSPRVGALQARTEAEPAAKRPSIDWGPGGGWLGVTAKDETSR